MGRYGSGKKVLDLFSYTGGFGIHLLLGGTVKSVFVEENPYVIETLEKNLQLNKLSEKVAVYEEKVEKFLDENSKKFDIVVIDPPASVQNKLKLRDSVRKYRNILSNAIEHIGRGLIFISSCSYFVKPVTLKKEVIEWGTLNKKRNIVYLGMVRGIAPDHFFRPVDKELNYLKAYLIKRYYRYIENN